MRSQTPQQSLPLCLEKPRELRDSALVLAFIVRINTASQAMASAKHLVTVPILATAHKLLGAGSMFP